MTKRGKWMPVACFVGAQWRQPTSRLFPTFRYIVVMANYSAAIRTCCARVRILSELRSTVLRSKKKQVRCSVLSGRAARTLSKLVRSGASLIRRNYVCELFRDMHKEAKPWIRCRWIEPRGMEGWRNRERAGAVEMGASEMVIGLEPMKPPPGCGGALRCV
jgi:hypothetical protein